MITKTEKKKLKTLLKGRWVEDVLEILKQENITNRDGKPYGESMIYHVLNGRNDQLEIEKAILKVFEDRANEVKNLQMRKSKILSA